MNFPAYFAAFFLAGSFFTKVIPQLGLGHLPGLSLNTSGCIGQVYCTFAGLTFLVVSDTKVVEWAASILMPENNMAIAINVTFFMDF
jgi:hypothetical protein